MIWQRILRLYIFDILCQIRQKSKLRFFYQFVKVKYTPTKCTLAFFILTPTILLYLLGHFRNLRIRVFIGYIQSCVDCFLVCPWQKQSSSDIHNAPGTGDNQMCTVHRQPIALDRLGIHDVPPQEATGKTVLYMTLVLTHLEWHMATNFQQRTVPQNFKLRPLW